jgi:lipopolysaccharide export system protein LptC
MKPWPSQTFPIILLALLAALTFWLQKTITGDETKHDGKLRHDPDAIAENFTVRRFDETGHLKYRLIAPYLAHFPDDDSSEIKTPTLISYRPDAPTVTITAKQATTTAKGETIYLTDDVIIHRAATAKRPEMLVRMAQLTAQPDSGLAFTDGPVEVIQGKSWIKGVGAHLDNNTSLLTLKSQVTGLYSRPRATP